MSASNEQNQDNIKEYGQTALPSEGEEGKIQLITIIGEVEGHENLPSGTKATKYEHILPKLAEVEQDRRIRGVLLLLNTVGGDVESGLAIAEMIASLSKPTVSLVLGGSHSIGVPLAVSTDHSFIVPTGTMVIHPVRMSGTVIRRAPDLRLFRPDAEPDSRLCGQPLQSDSGASGGDDDEYRDDGEGSGDNPRGPAGCGGRADRRDRRNPGGGVVFGKNHEKGSRMTTGIYKMS